MKDIHLIEKSARYRHVNDDEWVTGNWTMSAETAASLKGGTVFLHTAQKAPCYLGGKILECKEAENEDGRYVIRFRSDEDVVNTTTDNCTKNWSVEMLLEPIITT